MCIADHLRLRLLRRLRCRRRATPPAEPRRIAVRVFSRIVLAIQRREEKILARKTRQVALGNSDAELGGAGRNELRNARVGAPDYRQLRGLEGGLAVFFRGQLWNVHRLVGIDYKGGIHRDAVNARDAVILAGLRVVHAVGIAAEREIERDMVLMFADALLPAILGESIFGIKVTPVAVTANQTGAALAIWRHVQPDPAIGEVGVAGLVIEPG